MCSVIFRILVFSSLLLTVIIFRLSLCLRRLSTGGLWRGRTGPVRAAIETQARRGEAKGTCYVFVLEFIYFFFLFFFFSDRLQYNNRQDGTGRDGAGRNGTNAGGGKRRGAGQGGKRA